MTLSKVYPGCGLEIRMNEEIKKNLGNRPVVFVGMMGCGKSAIGRLVAAALNVDYFDADAEIEKAADMTIAEIFSQYGEEEFRRGEQQVIKRLMEKGESVVALGGGAFMAENTREVIKEHGISVWLDADIDLLVSRVQRRPGKRPLLKDGNPKEILSKLAKDRLPVYALADIRVNSSKTSKMKTRDAVLSGLHNYLSGASEHRESNATHG